MTEIADRYRRLAALFAETAADVADESWGAPSPCDEWTAREVVRHVVDSHGTFEGFIGRELSSAPSVDDDPTGAFVAASAAVQAHLEDPATATFEFDGFFGPTTFEAAVDRFLCFDLVVHRWDLAAATGLDRDLDPDDVARLAAAVQGFGPALRSPGVFGPEVAVPAGADAQTRLLGFLGRQA